MLLRMSDEHDGYSHDAEDEDDRNHVLTLFMMNISMKHDSYHNDAYNHYAGQC